MFRIVFIKSCALVADETVITELENYCKSISAGLAEGKIQEVLADTRLYYQTIFNAGGKTVAWDLVERLNGRIGQLRAVTLSSIGRSVTGPKNLLAIVAAIKAHDAETAAIACAEHLEQAKQIALNELDS